MNSSTGTLRRPFLLFGLALAACALVLAGWSTRSEAAVYCVPNGVPAGCDQGFVTIQAALTQAESNAGHDEVRIAPGTYTGSATGEGGFAYDNTDTGNTVDIVGAGHSLTTIALGNTTGSDTALLLHAPEGSSVSRLRVDIPANADGTGDYGLDLGLGNSADWVHVVGPNAENARGIICSNCSLTRILVALSTDPGDYNLGALGSGGDISFDRSTLIASTGLQQNDPGGTATFDHGYTKGWIGVTTDGGKLVLRDTLIELDASSGATGVQLENANVGPNVMRAELNGVTIVGGGDGSNGLKAIADNGTEGAQATITNTAISGPDHALFLRAAESRTVTVSSTYSAYDNATTSSATGPNGGTIQHDIGVGHIDLEVDPEFADPLSSNYTPTGASPLLDAGDPSDPGPGATDINGNPRACHGTDSGVIRRDIGAFEFKTDPNDDCTYPQASIGLDSMRGGDLTASFLLTSSKAGSEFLCSIDDKPYTACTSSFTTPTLTAGPHTLFVRAKDVHGNIQPTPTTKPFSVLEIPPCGVAPKCPPPPTCATDPTLCPLPDTTLPSVIGVKVAKKTKAKRVTVRFRADEPGVTFTCKLNKGKAKRCKSPWKTPRLKKGKNTIAIQATDEAGNKSKIVKRVIRRR